MARAAWPTTRDLDTFLRAAGLTPSNALMTQFPAVLIGAYKDFEKAAGRIMLAPASETRYFDPPNNNDGILFPDDLASISTVIYYPTNGSSFTYTANTDYWVEPHNAAVKEEPYTMIRFRRRWLTPLSTPERRSIQITGRFGYATSIPEDVWFAVLARAGWSIFPQAHMTTNSGIKSWQDGDRTVNYGDIFDQTRKAWAGEDGQGGIFGTTVQRYRKYLV